MLQTWIRLILFLALANFTCSETIRAGSMVNFTPFNFYNDQGVYDGIDVAIIERAASELNIDIVHHPRPWKRALADFKNEETEMLFQLVATQERFEQWNMVGPIRNNNSVWFVKKVSPIKDIVSLEELLGHRVGTVHGFTYWKEFDQSRFFVRSPGLNVDINIQRILSDRVDISLESELVLKYAVVKSNSAELIRVLPTPAIESERYIAFHKDEDGDRLAKLFQNKLDEFRAKGAIQEIINEWLNNHSLIKH